MNLIIIGAPGSGKGTQAANIVKDFNIAHISTGNMLREAIAKKTPEGILAEDLINNGMLVPDNIIFDMLNRRVVEDDCKNGFLLDGVPRNLTQIQFVEKLGIDKVLFIDVNFDAIIKRLSSRRSCKDCSGTFIDCDCKDNHCPKCGGEVYTRDDDKPEVVSKRLETYNNQTKPVVDYYKENTDRLVTINGNQSVEGVYKEIKKALQNGKCKE